jgi:RimJ/RimL family protein N-acetyltransferase
MTLPRPFLLRDGRSALIRRADPKDAKELLAHVNAVAAEGVFVQTERVDKTLDQERAWISGFDGRSSLLIVAVVDGLLLGSADFRRGPQGKNAHVAELGIALGKMARGQGLGRAIMEEGIEWARSTGVRKLFLGVFSTNDRAIALYRSLGFEEEGRLKGQVILQGNPADLVLMSRWLEPTTPPSTKL